ncbi:MAG: hypothetical protein K2H01_02325 [Ruminococcus sp.]|nr:hypothetical protein [Ruminococcus sp.]
MNIKIGNTICISVEALYNKYGRYLAYNEIICVAADSDYDDFYYDMYSFDNSAPALCDGEMAKVTNISDDIIWLENYDGEHFRMTKEEVATAVIK